MSVSLIVYFFILPRVHKEEKTSYSNTTNQTLNIQNKTEEKNTIKLLLKNPTMQNLGSCCFTIIYCLKETKILTTNIYAAADTYLFLFYIISIQIASSTRLSEKAKMNIMSIMSPLLIRGITEEFNFSETRFTDLITKRDEYFHVFVVKASAKEKPEIISDIKYEILEILKYDITYNKYVEFDESSAILITDFEETFQMEFVVNELLKLVTLQLDEALNIETLSEDLENLERLGMV